MWLWARKRTCVLWILIPWSDPAPWAPAGPAGPAIVRHVGIGIGRSRSHNMASEAIEAAPQACRHRHRQEPFGTSAFPFSSAAPPASEATPSPAVETAGGVVGGAEQPRHRAKVTLLLAVATLLSPRGCGATSELELGVPPKM